MRRMNLNRPGKPPGVAPTWKFDKSHGAATRTKGKGGIDWWRYQQHIIKGKLIPFANVCKRTRPDTIVQEDGAPSHNSRHQHQVWMDANIVKMLWPGTLQTSIPLSLAGPG